METTFGVIGQTIKKATLEVVEDGASGAWQVLLLEFEDGDKLQVRSQDSAEFQSWLEVRHIKGG